MTDRPPNPEDRRFDPDDEAQPGSDPGAAYRQAVESGEVDEADDDEVTGPDVSDAYRSGG